MGEILKDWSAPALIAAIESNQFAFWANLRNLPQVEFRDDDEMLWLITGIPLAGFNVVGRAQFATHEIDPGIDETLAHFQSRRVPMLWAVGPSTQPTNLGEHLQAHGLAHTEDSPAMAVNLLTLNEERFELPTLTIVCVSDLEMLKRWTQVWCIGFESPDFVQGVIFDMEASLGLGEHLPRRFYLGFLKGEPVATSLLFLGAGVAGIYGVATIPDARRQGIGAAMTLAPLREARAMGYRIGALFSSPMGLGVYRRLGFQQYFKFGHYEWAGENE